MSEHNGHDNGHDDHGDHSPPWESHESLEDLLKERHAVTRRSLEYLQGMQGILQGELAKILKKYKISSFEVKGHDKEEEIKSDMKKIIEDTLSYKHELHPLKEYVDSDKLDDDGFLQKLIDDIFTPHKQNILKAVGERDFMQQVQRYSQRQYQMLDEKANEYVFQGFDTTEEKHLESVAKYLSHEFGDDVEVKEVSKAPDKHLRKVYSHVITKYD